MSKTKILADAAKPPQEVTRRKFLRTTGAAAGAAAFASFFTVKDANAVTTGENAPDPVAPGAGQSIRYRYSVCQNCHSRCGIMAKIVGPAGSTSPAAGVLVKIEGNPYHQNNMEEDERLFFSEAPDATTGAPPQGTVGRLCPKGHAGVQMLYDPYRIKHPLKRMGSRGSGKWQAIPWTQAFSEIAAAWNALIPTASRLATDLNPAITELGKIANGVIFAPGRLPDGEMTERVFKNTYGTASWRLDHTSICEQSHHASNELMTWASKKSHFKPDIVNSDYLIVFGQNYLEAGFPMVALARKTVDFKKAGGKLVVVDPRFSNTAAKADTWVPAKPGTDGAVALGIATHIIKTRGVTSNADTTSRIATYLRNANAAAAAVDGETTWTDAAMLVVTAPAGQAGRYLRYTDVNLGPRTEGAGLTESGDTGNAFSAWSLDGINYGINTERDGKLIVRAVVSGGGTAVTVSVYKGTSRLAGEKVAEGSGVPGGPPIVLAQQLSSGLSGLVTVAGALADGNYDATLTVTGTRYVYTGSLPPIAIGSGAQEGNLLPGALIVNGLTCYTAYEILYKNVIEPYSVDYYAGIAGVDAQQIRDIADDFYNAGRTAVANAYRGTVQHTNGFWNMMGVMLLNALAGNYDWQGGNSAGASAWSHAYGTIKGTNTSGYPKGPRMDRAEVSNTLYEALNKAHPAEFPYPARRPWWPYGTHGNYQEIIPGVLAQYPNACKVLVTYWNAWPYSTPALRDVFLTTVLDHSKVPLFVAIDNVMGETSAYADYILPDTTYLEKWAFPGGTPTIMSKFNAFRQPVVGSYDGKAWDAPFVPGDTNNYNPVYPDTKMFEDILIGLMTGLGLTQDLGGTNLPARAWAHWKPAVDQLAASVFAASDPGKPALAGAADVGPLIARGGAFQDPGNDYNGPKLRYQYANEIRLYYEQLAWLADVMLDGNQKLAPAAPVTGGYLAVAHYEPIKDMAGIPVVDATYPFELITYKMVLHGQARTQNLPWLACWQPENFIEMNTADANALGLRTYDRARLSSASNPLGIVGRVRVTEGLRPGVVAVSHHFGHWQQSSRSWDASAGAGLPSDPTFAPGAQAYDPTRALGIQSNEIMRLDPYLKDVSLQCKIGCSCSFNDTRVDVQKV